MKKWTKIFSAVAVFVVVLLVALVVLSKMLITPERVKMALLPLAEETLHRKVDLGRIEVSIFSGIEIEGLKIYEQGGTEVFVSTDLARLRYQLLPLLTMKVVVDEVRMVKPDIRIVRHKDGHFNFSDLLGSSQTTGTERRSMTESRNGAPISLLVSNVLLQDGRLTFLDHALNDKNPYRYQLSELQVAAKGVSLTGEVPVSLQCQLNGSPLTLEGHLSLFPLGGAFDIALKGLDVVAFSPYLKDLLPGKLGSLKLSVKTAVSATADNIALNGTLSLAELDMVLDALPETPLKNATLKVDYDMQYNVGMEKLHLEQLKLDYNGIRLNAKGDVSTLLSGPVLDLMAEVPKLQLRQALNAVPEGLISDVGSMDPAGELAFNVNLSGPLNNALGVLKTARVNLDNVQATTGGYRPALTGQLDLAGDQVTSRDLHVRMGDNRADINITASHIFDQPVRIKADIASQRFELEPLLKGSGGTLVASDQTEDVGKKSSAEEELGPFDLPVHASGKIAVAETVWKGLVVKNFLASYELKDNLLDLTQIDGEVAGGSFHNIAQLDLGKKGLTYSAKVGLQSVQADPLITAFAPNAASSLLGALDLDFNIKGRGTRWEILKKKLSGQGDMLVTDGRLVSPGLVKGFASFLQLSDMDEILFSNFQGQVKIDNGKVLLDSSLMSDQVKLFPKGTISLDGMMKLAMDTRLSPQLSARLDRKGQVSKYLTDQDGWSQVPLLVSGHYTSPSFGLDPKGLSSQAQKVISNELGRQIDRLFKKTESETTEPGQQETGEKDQPTEDPARKLLQDSLQKLFGN